MRRLLVIPGLVIALGVSARAEPIETAVTIEVASDGSGNYRTLREAVASAPDEHPGWVVIHVGPGTYREALSIPPEKHHLLILGSGRDQTSIEWDRSTWDSEGRWVAEPVLTNRADDVVLRALAIRNLADEPGGSGGMWDAAVRNHGDRLILADVLARGDNDTLLLYGPGAGGSAGRVYVRDSHVQGRGDFIASFASVFLERVRLERIRDRGHFLFQAGSPTVPTALVVRDSVFTGATSDPVWPFGVSNLYDYADVYLIDNVLRHNAGANRPLVHLHAGSQAAHATIRYAGLRQALSNLRPLRLDAYSVPGPLGTPRLEVPVGENASGEPILAELTGPQAASVTPAWLFGDWDPRVEEPRFACEDRLDNDGDGGIDFDGAGVTTPDPQCTAGTWPTESAVISGCGLGVELALLLPILFLARNRRP